ncbi:MAG: hypothetical protein Q7T26_08395 [Dehalococcoidia bacterium]|nr:hypothetical protein [Dehalococcoidia bacterium]
MTGVALALGRLRLDRSHDAGWLGFVALAAATHARRERAFRAP